MKSTKLNYLDLNNIVSGLDEIEKVYRERYDEYCIKSDGIMVIFYDKLIESVKETKEKIQHHCCF